MTDAALLAAARTSWDERFTESPPLRMGVEDGWVVWAVCRAPSAGCNGYAMIPGEGHPWSNGFPRGEDSSEDSQRSRQNLRIISKIMQGREGNVAAYEALLSGPEDMAAVFEAARADEDWEDSPDDMRMDDFLEAHGGITYYRHPWVGFDTAHAWDVWDAEYDPHGLCRRYRDDPRPDWERLWTVERVVEEAKNLARQVSQIGALERQVAAVWPPVRPLDIDLDLGVGEEDGDGTG